MGKYDCYDWPFDRLSCSCKTLDCENASAKWHTLSLHINDSSPIFYSIFEQPKLNNNDILCMLSADDLVLVSDTTYGLQHSLES